MTKRAELLYAARLICLRLKEVPPVKGEAKSPQARIHRKLEAEAGRVAVELADSSESAPPYRDFNQFEFPRRGW